LSRWPKILFLICLPLEGFQAPPEAAAAFDQYAKKVEDGFTQRPISKFLWLDAHPEKKSLVWLSQPLIEPVETKNVGDAILQHWIGAICLTAVEPSRVRDLVLNFADWKYFFKPIVSDSKLVKREDPKFDATVRFSRRQIRPVVLDTTATAKYEEIDPAHASIPIHFTKIEEVRSDEGYLYRMNMYWRLEDADGGTWVEIELLTLSRDPGRMNVNRILTGFVQNFPRDLLNVMINDRLRGSFRLGK
jgi:hypothetical protein